MLVHVWTCECQNPVRNKAVLIKMVFLIILDHCGPLHLLALHLLRHSSLELQALGLSNRKCLLQLTKLQGKKKHININKFAGLSRDWLGAKNLFMCFFGSFLMGEKKHINKIPPKIPGQSRENYVYVFFSFFFFSFPSSVFV